MNYDHGVAYTPQKVAYHGDKDVEELLHGAHFVRLYWVDLANVIRQRTFTTSYFQELLQSNRPGMGIAKVALGLVFLFAAEGFPSMGEYLYVPDLSTIKPCPWAPGHISVLGRFEEKSPIPGLTGEAALRVNLCPRTILKRIVAEARAAVQAEFLVGFESEFILLKSTDPVEASNVHQWCASGGIMAGTKEATILDEIASSLLASGIQLQLYHAEAGPGQYEIVTGPLSPLEAADALIHTREIIYQTASKHGLRATFAPRPFMFSTGSSCHTHISVHSSTDSKKKPEGLSTYEAAFLAGVLDHLPSIACLTLPTAASYKRMVDGAWSGGTYVSWGTENRESPIRLANASSPSSRNFEVRCVDATANPHLALSAIIGCALTGLKKKQSLTIKDCPGPKSAAQLTEGERKALGIEKRMPMNIAEARENFKNNEVLGKVFGEEFMQKYIALNETLETAMKDEDELKELTRVVEMY